MHARADVSSEQAAETAAIWPEQIFAILQRFDVRQVPYVPDAGHSQLIERVLGSSSMRGIVLTTEEEGVALLAGAWAGGEAWAAWEAWARYRSLPWAAGRSRCNPASESRLRCGRPGRSGARADRAWSGPVLSLFSEHHEPDR